MPLWIALVGVLTAATTAIGSWVTSESAENVAICEQATEYFTDDKRDVTGLTPEQQKIVTSTYIDMLEKCQE